MSLVTEEIRKSATELYYGDTICQTKTRFLLSEVGLPNGLLPLKDIEECGYVKETGFVWLKQKKTSQHKFQKVGRLASYAPEVTAFVEKGKVKKLTGVKTKEMLMWLNLHEIILDDPPTGKITFKAFSGFSRSFPASAFVADADEEQKDKVKEEHLNGYGNAINGSAKEVALKEV